MSFSDIFVAEYLTRSEGGPPGDLRDLRGFAYSRDRSAGEVSREAIGPSEFEVDHGRVRKKLTRRREDVKEAHATTRNVWMVGGGSGTDVAAVRSWLMWTARMAGDGELLFQGEGRTR